jgi:ABC-type glycerol-3-phosphate transport system substrate-binding protein
MERFIVRDDQVLHPYLLPGYRDMLEYLRMLMDEGLIDIDSINRSAADCRALMFQGRSGVAPAGNWETITILELGQAADPDFDIWPLRTPRLSDPYEWIRVNNILNRPKDGAMYSISSTARDPVLAMRFIDYLYGPGNHIAAFGIGELPCGNWTYVWNENYQDYDISDYMLNNPEIPWSDLRAQHTLNPFNPITPEGGERALYWHSINPLAWQEWGFHVDDEEKNPGPWYDIERRRKQGHNDYHD